MRGRTRIAAGRRRGDGIPPWRGWLSRSSLASRVRLPHWRRGRLMRPAARCALGACRASRLSPRPEQCLSIQRADRNVAISPDGQHIVYRGRAAGTQLVVALHRSHGSRRWKIPPTPASPFFSPDGQWVGFFDGVTLKKVSMCRRAGHHHLPQARFREERTGLRTGPSCSQRRTRPPDCCGYRRAAASRRCSRGPIQAQGERDHFAPSLLPDGAGSSSPSSLASAAAPLQIAVLDFRTGQRKTLIRGGSQPQYVETGHLVYAAGRSLTAVRFDLDRLELQSDPVLLGEEAWGDQWTRPPRTTPFREAVPSSTSPPAQSTRPAHSCGWIERVVRRRPARRRTSTPGRASHPTARAWP